MVFMDRDYTKKKVRSLVAESWEFLYAIPVTKTRAFCEVLSIVSSPLLLIIVITNSWLCLSLLQMRALIPPNRSSSWFGTVKLRRNFVTQFAICMQLAPPQVSSLLYYVLFQFPKNICCKI